MAETFLNFNKLSHQISPISAEVKYEFVVNFALFPDVQVIAFRIIARTDFAEGL